MTTATTKQIDHLLTLANRVHGTDARYLSQIRSQLGLSSSKCSRGLTKVEASRLIDQLKAQVG